MKRNQSHFLLSYSMVIILSYCLAVSVHSLNSSTTITISCLPSQSSALLQFKREFTPQESDFGEYPKMRDWKAGSDCCLWEGVRCNVTTGEVVGLDLGSSRLHGPLRSNSSLFRLAHLRHLNLAFNNFESSPIPSELGCRLSRLTHLNLASSNFSGYIPSEISMLSNLVSLDLSAYSFGNSLYVREGDVGRLFHNMTKLRLIDLGYVNLASSSPVPQTISNLSFLTQLSLWDCDLHGEFPQNVFHLPKLQHLELSQNLNLRGSLPEFNSSSNLESLSIGSTSFSGKLPDTIGNLKSLSFLQLSYSSFEGTVPSSVWNLSELAKVYLSFNYFKGQFPSTLGNLPNLYSLVLDGNEFGGELPSSFANLTQLSRLLLSQNSFHGKFPVAFPYYIQVIDLGDNNLTGSIPSYNHSLPFLFSLSLSNNSFTGVIPSYLCTMPSLLNLYLDDNQFTDFDISNSSDSGLVELFLDGNEFHGFIPGSISKLKSLEHLLLGSNNFSGRVDFGIFSELSNLNSLDLSFNSRLSIAKTNADSASLPQFLRLYLSSCNISEFPDFLKTQDKLEDLDLSRNKIGGPVPKWFLGISTETLHSLNLSHNSISGWEEGNQSLVILPWNQLVTLDLRSNLFQGPLFVPPMSTRLFLISNNSLVGGIDPLFCKLSDLRVLDASHNHLSGTIPPCLGSLDHLSILKLASNNLHGNIPHQLCSSESSFLLTLDLSENQLHGKIPRSLIKCKELRVLKLGHNNIKDTFPFWLQVLPQLQVLLLCSNRFHGPISHSHHFFKFVMLRTIDLSHNDFTGSIPSQYFRNWTSMIAEISQKHNDSNLVSKGIVVITSKWQQYEYMKDSVTMMNKGQEMEFVNTLPLFVSMDLSDNKFSGEIPTSLWDLQALVMLNLSRNNFAGPIPQSLGNLKQLESLDLSNNMLSGGIPQKLETLSFLSYLNLSNNQLVGPIPQGGQVLTFENSCFEGNLGLCGLPLSISCTAPPSNFDDHSRMQSDSDSVFDFGWKVVAVGYGCGLLVGFLIGHVIISRRPNLISRLYRVRLQRRLR